MLQSQQRLRQVRYPHSVEQETDMRWSRDLPSLIKLARQQWTSPGL